MVIALVACRKMTARAAEFALYGELTVILRIAWHMAQTYLENFCVQAKLLTKSAEELEAVT